MISCIRKKWSVIFIYLTLKRIFKKIVIQPSYATENNEFGAHNCFNIKWNKKFQQKQRINTTCR